MWAAAEPRIRMDLDAINADPLLHDTPIGTLRVMRFDHVHGAYFAVCLSNPGPFGDDSVRIIHTLEPGEDVFSAVYGKRFWEQGHVWEMYCKQREVEEEAKRKEAAGDTDLDRDFRERIMHAFGAGQ